VLSSISTLADLFTRIDFWAGALAGFAALGVFLLLPRTTSGPRGWGIAVAATSLIGINLFVDRRLAMTIGIAVLAAGGWALAKPNGSDKTASVSRIAAPVGWVLIGVGALLVGFRGGLPAGNWTMVITPLVIVLIGYALSSWSDCQRRQLLGPLFLLTAFGIWTTVPDTESARVLLGASLPLSFATTKGVTARITSAGSFAAAGVVAWIGATGGAGRPSATIGAWACLGVLVAVPTIAPGLMRLAGWQLVGVQIVFVFLSARVFGLWHSTVATAIAVIGSALLLWIMASLFLPPSSEPEQQSQLE